uniref:basic leucine zipper 19-like n=1 Tax=Erigeron canadensis TaxID=72917 RepID=UPI001CB96D10|nr:basic leucine zipper 19-like [Erigeron canadensis]
MGIEDGELEFSNQDMFLGSNVGDGLSSGSMSSFFNEIFNDTQHGCMHTHTCNPPGPDSSHTHTCYHVHTKILSATSDDDKTPTDDTAESSGKKGKKQSSGNREAVRKYREKKKARTASLEDEVVRLRAMNQQLMKRIQSQVGLESEVGRLKCLLVDIRGRIEGEIGSFPYQKQQMTNQSLVNSCNMQSTSVMHHDLGVDGCDFEDQCLGNQGLMLNECGGCEANDDFAGVNPSPGTKRKGRRSCSNI